MDTDARGLLFFIFGFVCIWLVLDEFYGKKYISHVASLLTPTIAGPSIQWMNPQAADQAHQADTKKNQSDNSISQAQKDWQQKNIDHFWGDTSVH